MRFLFVLLIIFVISAALTSCVSTAKYNKLLFENRDLERTCGQKNQALSRENKVLYEEKIELEKEISILSNALESARSSLESEKHSSKSYKESTKQKVKELENRLASAEENSSRKMQELSKQSRILIDSLLTQIDSLSSQLQLSKREHSADVQGLKNDLAKRKYDYEKELYALTKLKDELFSRLQMSERLIQSLQGTSQPQSISPTK